MKKVSIFALPKRKKLLNIHNAEVAHLVERDLAKVEVAGSSPVFRSKKIPQKRDFFSTAGNEGIENLTERYCRLHTHSIAPVVELVDTQDLKSCSPQRECGFNSRLGHLIFNQLERLT